MIRHPNPTLPERTSVGTPPRVDRPSGSASWTAVKRLLAVFGLAAAVCALGLVSLPTSVAAMRTESVRVLSDENPYPDVNPCASGVSEISGSIKVCTLIREDDVVRVYTEPRRAMVWIQISATGPTAHVSDTVNGVAYVGGLTPRDDWRVSIQTWNLPPGLRLESQLVFLNVRVEEARSFVFVCDSPPCNQPAPTSTPTITSPPPGWTPSATPSPTVTLPVSPATPAPTVAVSATPTATSVPPTAGATATSEISATATLTITPTATVDGDSTPTSSPEPSPTAAEPPSPTPTVPPTGTATETPTATGPPEPSAPPTLETPTAVPPTATPDPAGGKRLYVPIAGRRG